MNSKNRRRQQETASPLWDQLRKLDDACGHIIEEEIMCDLLRGPEDEECQKLFLQNEDCYQRVLCHERWQEALSCLRTQPRETCERFITRSRNCKEDFFAHMLSPPYREHLKKEAKVKLECEEFQIRHANCLAAFGPLEKECLDRQNLHNQCILGKTVPKQHWKEWKLCEQKMSPEEDPNVSCFDELERFFSYHKTDMIMSLILSSSSKLTFDSIRTVLHERSYNVGLSVPGMNTNCFKETGGPDGALDFMSRIFYGSHHERIFKQFDPRIHKLTPEKVKSGNEEKS